MQWLSKKQSTIETSVFGVEFVAIKQGIGALRGLRYKLRMMGIQISSPSNTYLVKICELYIILPTE